MKFNEMDEHLLETKNVTAQNTGTIINQNRIINDNLRIIKEELDEKLEVMHNNTKRSN